MAFNSLYSDKDTPSRLFPHLIGTDTGKSDAINAAFVAELIGIDDIIRTVGYHEGSDLGGCTYRVVASATGTDDGGSYIDFTGFQLEAVFTSTIPAACFGSTANPIHTQTSSWFIGQVETRFTIIRISRDLNALGKNLKR